MTNLATPSADARAGPRPSGGTPSIATLMGAGRGRISVFFGLQSDGTRPGRLLDIPPAPFLHRESAVPTFAAR
jgi:hypothetical protein